MTNELTTLDTNILIYSIDRTEGLRHRRAVQVIEEVLGSGTCVLTLQALGEFFFAVTRKEKMPLQAAREHVSDWMTLFPVVSAQPSSLQKAIKAVKEHHLSFWDSLLWATAKEYSITQIISEDFQHEREIGGVLYVNPFLS